MKPLEKCIGVLRILIADASNPNVIVLAEKAVGDYLSDPEFRKASAKRGAIVFLKKALDQLGATGAQLSLISTLHEYLERQTRELAE
jgi:hypothetical protein